MSPFLESAITQMLPNADAHRGCGECGFDWTLPGEQALDSLRSAPDAFAELLQHPDADSSPGTGVWSPSAYVWHLGDVIRAWAERLHGLTQDPAIRWAGFDPDVLARARGYNDLPPVTASWALARSTADLLLALGPLDLEVRFSHPEWGSGTVADALRWLAHEAVHHELDVRRGLDLV